MFWFEFFPSAPCSSLSRFLVLFSCFALLNTACGSCLFFVCNLAYPSILWLFLPFLSSASALLLLLPLSVLLSTFLQLSYSLPLIFSLPPFPIPSASHIFSHLFSLSLIPSSSSRCFLHRKRICASSPKAEFALCFLIAKMISICFASLLCPPPHTFFFTFVLFSMYSSRYYYEKINVESIFFS